MQQNVFISYRRTDSAATVRKLVAALRSSLPSEIQIFLDVDDVDPGRPIPDKLRNALELSKVLLVVIGADWLTIGRERFESENDLVRFEIEYGLSLRRVCVIPVLVDGATMPAMADLPGRLKSLVHNEAVTIRTSGCDKGVIIASPDFDRDIGLISEKTKTWLRPSIRIGGQRDAELLKWDYVDLLREMTLLDLEAVDILGSDESVDRSMVGVDDLVIHPTDPLRAASAQGQIYFKEMSGKDSVPFAATSRGVRYRQTISAGGGTLPYTFNIASGELPPGLSLDSATGEISGKPTAGGEYSFVAQVTDARGKVARRRFTINGDEGTPEDWARVFEDYPDTWRIVLNKNDEILGYWHTAPLQDRYLDGVKAGAFKAGEVTADKLKLFHMFPGTYDLFFVIVVLRKDYRIGEDPSKKPDRNAGTYRNPRISIREVNDVHRTLFDSFFDALEELARRDVFVRELVADVWTQLGKGFFEHFGMEEILPCPREDLVAMCAGRIETILGKHAQRYSHLIERYREQMEGWSEELFDKAAGRTLIRRLQSGAGGVPVPASSDAAR
jgi:hypothetical protein